MAVEIPSEFAQFVQEIIASGDFRSETEVVGKALQLLKKREQLRREVNAGIEQLQQGKGIDGEEVFQRLERKAEDMARKAVAKET